MNGLWEAIDRGWAWVLIILVELLAGLLIARRMFSLPNVKETAKHSCCDNLTWETVADFDCAAGFDFDLGQCANCGAYVMAVFHVSSRTYNVISDEQAKYFLALKETPELKKALKRWVD